MATFSFPNSVVIIACTFLILILGCNECRASWQMEQPILFFINYVNVTDVYVTEPDVIRPYYLFMSHGS